MVDRNKDAAPPRSLGGQSPSPSVGGDIAAELDRFQEQQELADPDRGLPLADRLVNRAIEAIGVVCLAAIFVIVFASTLGRYVLGQPLIWGEEVVLGIIPWLVASGMFLSVRRRRLVKVEFISSKLPARAALAVSIFGQLLSIFVFAYLSVAAYRYLGFFGRDPTPYLGLPKGLSTSAYLFSGAATTLAFAVGLLQYLLISGPHSRRQIP
jgi:TRAP-type transport system small permease protein